MHSRLAPLSLAPLTLALGALLAPAGYAQTITVTGRGPLPWGGSWTGRTRVVDADACRTGRRDARAVVRVGGQVTLSTGRSGSPVVVVSGGRATCAPPQVVCDPTPPAIVVDRRVVDRRWQRVEPADPWCGRPAQRTVSVLVTAGPQPAPRCEPRQALPVVYQDRVVCQEPIPWAEPVAVPCPTAAGSDAPRGPADWTGRRRATANLPGPAPVDPLDPDRDCLTPPPAELIADELLLALASEDLVKACRLARWLERGRDRWARQVQAAFYARTPSPTLLRQAARRLGRDCQDLPGRGSLLRLLGAEGSGF